MTLILFLLLANLLILSWAAGIAQIMEKEKPWWRRRFRICWPVGENTVVWLYERPNKPLTWQLAECSASTFSVWRWPWVRLGLPSDAWTVWL